MMDAVERSEVRAVVLDAVGTLIHPEPDAIEVYARVGRGFGSRLSRTEVSELFRNAFRRQEDIDRHGSWQTSEARELQRWREIVAESLPDVRDTDACFQELYEHFQVAAHWRLEEGTADVLAELLGRGIQLAIASNFDHRLRSVVAGLGELQAIATVIVSGEIGWRKPARAFFAAVASALELDAKYVLYVGDEPENDVEAARKAGMMAVLVGARPTAISLAHLPGWLNANAGSGTRKFI